MGSFGNNFLFSHSVLHVVSVTSGALYFKQKYINEVCEKSLKRKGVTVITDALYKGKC